MSRRIKCNFKCIMMFIFLSIFASVGFAAEGEVATPYQPAQSPLFICTGTAETSAAATATDSARLLDGASIYQARFNSADWTGELISFTITSDGDVDTVAPPKWTTDDTLYRFNVVDRKIFSWNGSAGFDFGTVYDDFDASQIEYLQQGWDELTEEQKAAYKAGWGVLTEEQKAAYKAGWVELTEGQRQAYIAGWDDLTDDQKVPYQNNEDLYGIENYYAQTELAKDYVLWLRGSYAADLWVARVGSDSTVPGPFRTRAKLLGDIVNSDPRVVQFTNFGYSTLYPDAVDAVDIPYTVFLEQVKSTIERPAVLYVGSNDGMLHAFNAETGVELFSYVPAGVYENLWSLTRDNYTDTDNHRYFVDGSVNIGDAYINGQWKTILVGSLGAGGKSIFALDVTDPDKDKMSASNVLWEFTYADQDCTVGVTACREIGYTIGQPVLARMNDGSWAVIFGNGYVGEGASSSLFIVNVADGTLIKRIDTYASESDKLNGLSSPALLVNNQSIVTTAYAGDLLGNVWKFDLSSAFKDDWEVAFNRNAFFTAKDANGIAQPITAPIEIGPPPKDLTGYMVYFGTGKYFDRADHTFDGVNLIGADPQHFYGLYDNGSTPIADKSSLVGHKIFQFDVNNIPYRTVTSIDKQGNNEITVDYWKNNDRGWFLELYEPGERVISAPLLRFGRVIFTTLIPRPCGGTSWLMELDAIGGTRLKISVFDINDDGKFDDNDFVTVRIDNKNVLVPVSGVKSTVGIIKTPAIISAGSVEYKYFSGSEGDIEVIREASGGTLEGLGRRSWRQLQ